MTEIRDKLIGFSNVKRGKNKKGNDRFQLYLTCETATELAEILIEKANGTDVGVKLDLHFNMRTNSHTGHDFESAFMFVKEKQAMGQDYNSKKVVKKVDKEAIKDKIKKLKSKNIEE